MTGSSSLGVEHLEGIPPSRIQESCKVIDHLHVFFEQHNIACLSLCIRTVEPALSVWHALMSSIYRSTTTAFVCEPKVPSAFSTSPSPLLPRRNTFNQSFINMTCCFFHADLEALELVITGLITAGGGPCRWGGKDDAVKLELRFGWASVVRFEGPRFEVPRFEVPTCLSWPGFSDECKAAASFLARFVNKSSSNTAFEDRIRNIPENRDQADGAVEKQVTNHQASHFFHVFGIFASRYSHSTIYKP